MTTTTRSSRFSAAAAGIALVAASLSLATPAEAAKSYSSCAELTKDFRSGVARSKKAANWQVKQGNRRPAHGKRARAVYKRVASNLDRDKDGTACEQSA